MQEYLLFIDTETTGLPRKWTATYEAIHHWPSAVEVAWILYTRDGKELKRENFYVSNNDVPISSRALEIHGYHQLYLQEYGVPREQVMQKLGDDLKKYHPLVVGHFVTLDVHVLGADFFRCSMVNPLPKLPLFCTMVASGKYVKKPWMKYLRLGEFYEELFGEVLENTHNALVDAEATANIFFELTKRGEIDDRIILEQQPFITPGIPNRNKSFFIILCIIVLSIILVGYLIFQFYG